MTAPLTGAADSLYRWLDVANDVASMDVAEQMIRDVIAEAKAEEREACAAIMDYGSKRADELAPRLLPDADSAGRALVRGAAFAKAAELIRARGNQ